MVGARLAGHGGESVDAEVAPVHDLRRGSGNRHAEHENSNADFLQT